MTLAEKLLRGDSEMARLLGTDECELFRHCGGETQKRPPVAIRFTTWKYEFDETGRKWWKRRLFAGEEWHTALLIGGSGASKGGKAGGDPEEGTKSGGGAAPEEGTKSGGGVPKYNSFRYRCRLGLLLMVVAFSCFWWWNAGNQYGPVAMGVGGIAFLASWLLVLADYF